MLPLPVKPSVLQTKGESEDRGHSRMLEPKYLLVERADQFIVICTTKDNQGMNLCDDVLVIEKKLKEIFTRSK